MTSRLPQTSRLAEVIRDSLAHSPGLIRVLNDGTLGLDTNPIALTRQTARFEGHEVSAENRAMRASLVATCKMSGANPVDQIAATLRPILDGQWQRGIEDRMPWHDALPSRLAAQGRAIALAKILSLTDCQSGENRIRWLLRNTRARMTWPGTGAGTMADFLDWEAHRILQAMATGGLTAEALMAATLDRIAARNGRLNAIVSLRDRDGLMEQARAADAAPRTGALQGLPMAVKDLADVAGMPTSHGSPVFADHMAARSDIMVQRMQDAGAIIIGKTNVPEFGLGSHTINPVFGATRNALHPGLSAGGSSGGAAVALATGMVALADGSDEMGSLRNPAGWNGIYGMRPSIGRVPSEPDGDMFLNLLATNGPMARCPRDIALLLEIQSGYDPRQPLGLPSAPMQDRLDVDLAGRRIGWLGNWGDAYPTEAGLLSHCRAQLERLGALGCVIEELPPPFDAALMWEAWTTLRSWGKAQSLGAVHDANPGQLKPEAVWEITRGRKLTNAQITRASAIRSDWMRCAADLFTRYDALVLPSAQCFPFPIHWDWPQDIAGKRMDTYHRWMEIVIPASLIGLPALAVPCAPARDGLPIGLQIIGPPRGDLGVLQLGQGWHGLGAAGPGTGA